MDFGFFICTHDGAGSMDHRGLPTERPRAQVYGNTIAFPGRTTFGGPFTWIIYMKTHLE